MKSCRKAHGKAHQKSAMPRTCCVFKKMPITLECNAKTQNELMQFAPPRGGNTRPEFS